MLHNDKRILSTRKTRIKNSKFVCVKHQSLKIHEAKMMDSIRVGEFNISFVAVDKTTRKNNDSI